MLFLKILGWVILVPGFIMFSDFMQLHVRGPKSPWKDRFKSLLISVPFFVIGSVLLKVSGAF